MASSSSACAWPYSESSRLASIRDSSRIRAGWSSRVTPLAVTRPSPDFSTTRWLSANAATWGRWVTTITCEDRASRARRRPISTAARPPTPASTSSNTNVGTGSAPANTTSMASMTRDSSPPEAPLCSGSGGAPGCAASLISTSSAPYGPGSSSSASTAVSDACGMASSVSSAVTSAANRSAACERIAVRSAASDPTWVASSASSSASAGILSVSPSSSASRAAACLAQSRTPAMSPDAPP